MHFVMLLNIEIQIKAYSIGKPPFIMTPTAICFLIIWLGELFLWLADFTDSKSVLLY